MIFEYVKLLEKFTRPLPSHGMVWAARCPPHVAGCHEHGINILQQDRFYLKDSGVEKKAGTINERSVMIDVMRLVFRSALCFIIACC